MCFAEWYGDDVIDYALFANVRIKFSSVDSQEDLLEWMMAELH